MIEQIIAAVREAGKIVLSASDIERATSEKGVGNFVTKYDVAVQEYLRGALLAILPEAHFMGEEGREHEDSLHGLCFIVDPIDGTANFVRGLCCSAISVALARDGELIAGVVYQPYIDEIFYAEKGKGAFRNGQPIHASPSPAPCSTACSTCAASARPRSSCATSPAAASSSASKRCSSPGTTRRRPASCTRPAALSPSSTARPSPSTAAAPSSRATARAMRNSSPRDFINCDIKP